MEAAREKAIQAALNDRLKPFIGLSHLMQVSSNPIGHSIILSSFNGKQY